MVQVVQCWYSVGTGAEAMPVDESRVEDREGRSSINIVYPATDQPERVPSPGK